MKVRWIKRNDIFILKFTYSLYLRKYIQLRARQKYITYSLHFSACKQTNVDPKARSFDSEHLECAPIDWSGCLRTHEILLWMSQRTDIWLLWVLGCLRTTFQTRPQWQYYGSWEPQLNNLHRVIQVDNSSRTSYPPLWVTLKRVRRNTTLDTSESNFTVKHW